MPLQLLLGASGTGKTKLLYEKLIASAAARPSLRHIALVPEQFTMETQRRLVTMTPNHAILNIDILSFERLAYRVFEEQNLEEWQILDDIGKNMLLRRVAGKKKKELLVFQKNLGRAGFISRMKSMLSELYQYGVGEEELTEMMERVKAMVTKPHWRSISATIWYWTGVNPVKPSMATTAPFKNFDRGSVFARISSSSSAGIVRWPISSANAR